MTGQPDIDAALGWSEQVIRDVSYLMAALRGEPTPPLRITGPPVPLASLRDREHYGDAASPCIIADGHEGAHRDASGHEWDGEPAEHYCPAAGLESYRCTLHAGHAGPHEAEGASPLPTWYDEDTDDGELDVTLAAADEELLAYIKRHVSPHIAFGLIDDSMPGPCPARWGEGDYLSRCSLPSGHPGQHADHGIEYAGHWETAEPGAKAAGDAEPDPAAGMWTGNTEAIDDARNGGRARYADHAAEGAERPGECICLHFTDTSGYRIADLACPVHGLGSTQPATWPPSTAGPGHLPQHKGGHPECTLCGEPGHHLHAASIPPDGA